MVIRISLLEIIAAFALVQKLYLSGHAVHVEILRIFSLASESNDFIKVIYFFQNLAIKIVE